MITQAQIRSSLESVVETWANAQGYQFQKEGQQVDWNGAIRIETWLLPNEPLNPTIGDTLSRENGIFQITIVSDSGIGATQSDTVAQNCKLLYNRGQSLSGVMIPRTPAIKPSFLVDSQRHTILYVWYEADSFN